MKGCFVLQRQFAYIGHDLIAHLKERYGLTEFCGYVYSRLSYNFLRTQTEIKYSALLLDEDIHARYKDEVIDPVFLAELQKEFGIPNLWPYLTVDRIVMSNQIIREYPYDKSSYTHEDMMKILQVKAKAILAFLEKEKPDYLFSTQPGGVGSLLLYHIAKKKGVKTNILILPTVPNKATISRDFDFISGVETAFRRNLKTGGAGNPHYEAARAYLASFRAAPRPYSKVHTEAQRELAWADQFKFILPKNAFRSVTFFATLLYRHLHAPDKYDYTYEHPWNYLKDHVWRKCRNFFLPKDVYDSFDSSRPYAFFGLHLEPEVSLLLLAPFVADQVWLTKQIARSLPLGYTLYVKDHPRMAAYRPRAYYKALKKIPNVKLLHPAVSSYEVTQESKLVFSVTGSIGFEGALLGKPVITFGRAFYNHLSGVVHCRTIEDLPEMIQSHLVEYVCDDNELVAYLAAIFEDAAEVDLLQVWEREFDGVKRRAALRDFADVLAKKIGAKKKSDL